MCFSFEVSIATFLFSWSIGIYLLTKDLNKEEKYNVIFLLIFSSMQLVDAILWYSGMKRNNVNFYTTSYLIPSILAIQILFNVYYNNSKNKFMIITALICVIILFFRFRGYSKGLCDNNFSSPIWASRELQFWEMIFFAFMIFYPNIKFFLMTTLILFPLLKIVSNGGYGSLWCAVSNLMAVYYLIEYRK